MKNIIRDKKHLEFIRSLPCVKCGQSPVDAAHIRMGGDYNSRGGTGLKPSDNRVVSLCRVCHSLQHAHGELKFWRDIEKAHELANSLWVMTGDRERCVKRIARFKCCS